MVSVPSLHHTVCGFLDAARNRRFWRIGCGTLAIVIGHSRRVVEVILNKVLEIAPSLAPLCEVRNRVNVVCAAPHVTRFVVGNHSVDAPTLLVEVHGAPLRRRVESNLEVVLVGGFANLDADAVPVSVANVPRNGVSAHGLVHRAAVSPVSNPLRHRRIIAHSLPILNMVPSCRTLVSSGMHYKVLRLEPAVTVCDEVVMFRPCVCGRGCADQHSEHGKRRDCADSKTLHKSADHSNPPSCPHGHRTSW